MRIISNFKGQFGIDFRRLLLLLLVLLLLLLLLMMMYVLQRAADVGHGYMQYFEGHHLRPPTWYRKRSWEHGKEEM
jgi:H+/Cl- antiporter ClcA